MTSPWILPKRVFPDGLKFIRKVNNAFVLDVEHSNGPPMLNLIMNFLLVRKYKAAVFRNSLAFYLHKIKHICRLSSSIEYFHLDTGYITLS